MLWPLAVALTLALTSLDPEEAGDRAELVGVAALPAATFEPAGVGHPSGHFLDEPIDGVRRPRYATQPIGNVSGLAPGDAPGEFLALADNGYGAKARSADFLLSVYRLRPAFRTGEGGDGSIAAELASRLSDPDKHVPWPIVADAATYPDSDVPVPAEVRERRLLTGGDFCPESIAKAEDGTFWIGDDYGPFLLHVDAEGRLLGPPVETQVETLVGPLHSPDHPTKDAAAGLVQRDGGGFVGLTLDLYDRPVAVLGRPPRGMEPGLPFQIFDLAARAAGVPWVETAYFVWLFHLPGQSRRAALGRTGGRPGRKPALPRASGRRGGASASPVRGALPGAVRTEGREVPVSGAVVVADLLNLADPHDLDGDSDRARFRFDARDPAALLILDDRTVVVASDNGHPSAEGGEPTRLIVVRAAESFVPAPR